MKKFLFLSFLIFAAATIHAQTYNMAPGTINSCGGTFYDSGGNLGNYNANQNITMTFCPVGGGGIHTSVQFTHFDVHTTDNLCIYDGNSATDTLIGCFNNANSATLLNLTVVGSDYNPSGCLTFVFTSDPGPSQATGWSATLGCRTPCQSLLSTITSTNPQLSSDTTIDICPGGAVTLSAAGNYIHNDSLYHQSDASSWFSWKFGDGDTTGGRNMTTVTHAYALPGGYHVTLVIHDTLGCTSPNDIETRVRVSTKPSFNGTHANINSICQGDTAIIYGQIKPTMWNGVPTTVTGSVFLPDGDGASYETSINYTVFQPGQTLTNINDLLGICMTMEHSYLGDLKLEIYCPNGQHVTLKDYPGGSGCFLGKPIDDDACLTAGQGLEYCFKPGATTHGTMLNSTGQFYETYSVPIAPCTSVSPPFPYTNEEYLPAGDYQSQNPLTGLLGCPLNGDWKIKITDNLSIDNGYIFSWSIYLNPNLYAGVWSFTPHFDSLAWSGPGIVTYTGDTTIGISPDTTGLLTYTFTGIDNFGCSYDTIIKVTVNPLPGSNFIATPGIMCNTDTALVTYLDTPVAGATYTWDWAGGIATPSTGVGPHHVRWTTPGIKIITLTVFKGACSSVQTIDTVVVNTMPLSTFTLSDDTICAGEVVTVHYLTVPITGADPTWDFDGGTVISGSGFGDYVVTWGDGGQKNITLSVTANGCVSPLTTHTVEVNLVPVSTFGAVPNVVCTGDTVMAFYIGTLITDAVYNWGFSSGTVFPGIDPSGPHKIIWNVAGTKEISLLVTANGCTSDTTKVSVTVHPIPTSPFSVSPNSVCTGESSTITYIGTPIIAGATYNWVFDGGVASPGGQVMGPHAVNWTSAGVKNITLTVSANGCTSTQTVHTDTVILMPTAVFTVNPNPVCFGDSVDVIFNGISSPASTLFVWDFGGGVPRPPGLGAGPHRVFWASTGSISLTVKESAHCSATSPTIPVVINPIPTIHLVAPKEVCANASATINYTGDCGSTCNYDWHNFDGGTVITGSGSGPYQVAWTNPGYKNIALKITDANGCSNYADTTVVVNPLPDLKFTTSRTEGCDSFFVVKFTDKTVPTPNVYNWNLGNGTNFSSCCPEVTYHTGNYDISLTVTDAKQCSKSVTYPHHIVVHPMPEAQFEALPEISGPNFPVQFNSTSTGDIASWLWDFKDKTIIDASAYIEHPFTTVGTYDVLLTVKTSWQCTDTYSKTIEIIDITVPNVFTPNGDSKNDLWVIKGNESLVDTKVLIFNRWGKKVYESNNYKNDWDGNGSSDGVYYYVVNFKNDMFKPKTGFVTILTDK